MARGKADGYIYVDTKVDEEGFKKGTGRLKKAGVAAAAVIATAVVAAGAAFVNLSLKAEKAVTAENRIRNIAENMGYLGDEADTVTQRLVDYAEATARATGIDANSIKATQAKLGTFSELAATMDEAGGAFDRATQAAIDMAAAGFGDAESNAVQLGKALQDPIKGITALNRSGVTFTESQKEMIEGMVESGDMLGAQNLILNEIEKQVGGTAEATSDASARMRVAWDLAQESIGKRLLPTFEKLSAWVIDVGLPAFEKFIDGIDFAAIGQSAKDIWSSLSPVFDALDRVKLAAMGIFDAFRFGESSYVTEAFGGPVMDAIRGFVDILLKVPEVFATIREIAQPVLDTLKASFQELKDSGALTSMAQSFEDLKPLLTFVAQIIGGVVVIVLGTLIGIINGVVRAIGPLINAFTSWQKVIANVFNLVKGIITGDGELIKEAMEGIKDGIVGVFSGLWGAIKGYVSGMVDGVVSFFRGLYNTLVGNSIIPDLIRDIVRWFAGLPAKAVREVVRFATQVVAKFRELPGQVAAAFSRMGSIGKDLVTGLWNGINDKFAWLTGKIKGFATNVTDRLKGFFGISSPSKLFEREIGVNLALGVGKGFSGSMADVTRQMASTVNSEVGRLSAGLSVTGGTSYGGLTIHVDARGSDDPSAIEAAGHRGVFAALEEAVLMGRLREGMMG